MRVFESDSAKRTAQIGESLAKEAHPGDIFCLDGDLGVGKTVLTQGFAKGLGITEPVNSPTFTILQIYKEGRMPLYHFDVYRLGDPSELEDIGYEEYFYSDGVCLVEWGSQVEELLPPSTKYITIQKDLDKGFDYRRITVRDGNDENTGD